ncbi:MAG: tetratricopeptide repeat protein [Treponema sp.]|nr:tetratricopeptide repeat protein [Treponema sp.]
MPASEPKEIPLPRELTGKDTPLPRLSQAGPAAPEVPAEEVPAEPPAEIPAEVNAEDEAFNDDLDFGDLLGSSPGDFALPPDDIPAPSSEDAADPSGADDDFDIPAGDGGQAEVPAELPAELPAEFSAETPSDLPDMDLGLSNEDFDIPVDDAGQAETPVENAPEVPSSTEEDSGAEFSAETPSDLPDMDLGLSNEDFDIPVDDAGQAETPAEIPSDLPGGEPNLPTDEDLFEDFNPDGRLPGGIAGDSPDGGEPRQGESAKAGGGEGQFPDLEDFSLSGIDGLFGAQGVQGGAAVPEGASHPVRNGKADIKDVEEINLSEEDYARLEETLASYPLNLRVVCEELIAEQAVAPDLMASLIKLLVRGGSPREAASLTGKILGRSVSIPKGFEKKTGADLEAEQASFSYIFLRHFLPVFRIILFFAALAASLCYLGYQFIYKPLWAESIYKKGYERIGAGEYERANERFSEAFTIHRKKEWFYRYAEGFRAERQYIYAAKKYEDLLRFYPRDKKGVLDYAAMETNELRNYSEADRVLRQYLLDYSLDDREGLLALGDNNLAWGESEPARYENARQAYARLLELYGWKDDAVVERMMLYFIRTDDLAQVLPLQAYFMDNPKRKIRPSSLSELGGYLLNKRLEETRGVPDENIARIGGIRDLLQRAANVDPAQPESHYHLARYYNHFGAPTDERLAIEKAIRAFDAAQEETPRRTGYRIAAERQYAQLLINSREFIPAERELIKGIDIYEDALERRLLSRSPDYGRLYADLGDLEYFTAGDMTGALDFYRRSEQNGWAPVEIQYRMGVAHYQLRQWEPALERFFIASAEMPLSRRLLYSLGNVSYQRGNYSVAQGYYSRLLDLLEADNSRFPALSPNERRDHMELAERLMVARNNLGVTMEALADASGRASYRSRALGLYAESSRAWDSITRDPVTMVRSGAGEISTPGVNLAYLNSRNALYPVPDFEPQIYIHIDKDVLEPSLWEELAPSANRLSYQLFEE